MPAVTLRLPAAATLLLLLGAPDPGSAQESQTLRGQVVDSLTGAPVPGAIVRVSALERYTITNDAGWFIMTGLPAGWHALEASQLGYGQATPWVRLPQDAPLVVYIAPQPIVLDAVRAHNDRLYREARARAHRWVAQGAGFFRVFDRDKILATGAADALEFLRRGPRMPIKICDINDERERLCTRIAFEGATGAGMMGGNFTAWERQELSARLRRARNRDRISAIKAMAYPPVYLDDEYVTGGLASLDTLPTGDIHRVETYGLRGEKEIRLYTAAYLELLATGVRRPVLMVPPRHLFDPPALAVDPDPVQGVIPPQLPPTT
jgi:hypothetical protein